MTHRSFIFYARANTINLVFLRFLIYFLAHKALFPPHFPPTTAEVRKNPANRRENDAACSPSFLATSQHIGPATPPTTDDMEHRGGKSGGDRKNGARAVAAGKKSNTKAKQGSQRGGRAGYLVTTRLSIFNI